MRALGVADSRRRRRAAVAAALGGLLWTPYGVFEMLQPWGTDTVYRDDRGYEVVTDTLLYWVYSLPGSLALLLTTLGLLGVFALLGRPAGRAGRSGRVLAYVALALALLSVAGLVVRFDPLFTAPRIVGTLALGIATLLAGVEVRRTGATKGWAAALLALGLLGLFLLPLWPLVYAVAVVPEGAGAGVIALFGLGWVLVGYRLWLGQGRTDLRRPWHRRPMNALGTNAPATSARWQRAADQLARWAWPVLLAAVALALVGGVVIGAWHPNTEDPEPDVEECADPPCFGGGGLPSARDLPAAIPLLGYGLTIVLGLPSLLAGGWDLLRGRWATGGRRLLAFVGPVLILIGTEIVPHVLSPCLPTVLGADWLPPLCERTEHGVDVKDRWHALDHALVGALPMAALYWRALRRWRPDVVQVRVA